jgi:hypothetical protein
MLSMSVLLSAGFIVEGVSSRLGRSGQVSKKARGKRARMRIITEP